MLSCIYFSVTRPGRTVAPILTLSGSNDVFPPKDGPFGGHGDRWRHMKKYAPKTTPKGAWIGSFKPKHQNLYIAISPELLIWRTSDLRIEFRRKALRWWSAITRKQIQYGWWPPSWKSIWYCGGGWSSLDKIRQPDAEQHADYGEWSISKPEVEFQYGGRLFFKNGSSYSPTSAFQRTH